MGLELQQLVFFFTMRAHSSLPCTIHFTQTNCHIISRIQKILSKSFNAWIELFFSTYICLIVPYLFLSKNPQNLKEKIILFGWIKKKILNCSYPLRWALCSRNVYWSWKVTSFSVACVLFFNQMDSIKTKTLSEIKCSSNWEKFYCSSSAKGMLYRAAQTQRRNKINFSMKFCE